MTDWINDLYARLPPAEQDANKDRAASNRKRRLIAQGAPEWFERAATAAMALAAELNERLPATLGFVTFERNGSEQFTVACGGATPVNVAVRMDIPKGEVAVHTTTKGNA